MRLTSEEESALLARYEHWLRKMVNRLSNNMQASACEDLMQEARIAFLLHIREITSEKDIFMCNRNVQNAIFEHARRMSPIHISKKDFANQRERFEQVPESELMEHTIHFDEDTILHNIIWHNFLSRIKPDERMVLFLKAQGYGLVEIQKAVKINSMSKVVRILMKQRQRIAVIFDYEMDEEVDA